MKINKKELLTSLQADLKASETLQKEWLAKRNEWISETYGKPYGNEEKNKSSIVSKDIKKQLEWMLPGITDPFLSTPDVIKCNPVTWEDRDAAKQSELLLNSQFCRKFNRYNFIMKATRVLATEGTVVIQTGWDYEDEEVETMAETVSVDELGNQYVELVETTETKVLRNQPTAKVCRNEDIFIDPTCQDDMDKCQFVIYRYETDLSTLRADGRYKNLGKLAKSEEGEDIDYDSEDDTEFRFKDAPRKKMVVYEYWGNYDVDDDGEVEAIICAWVGDTIIRLESNPYPDEKPPFIVVPFNAIPFQMFGEALAENIGDNQKVKTAITRGILDSMTSSNNGQIGVRKGSLDPRNKKLMLAGRNFEYNGTPNDFWQGSYNNIPGSAFDLLAVMNNEIESQTGTKSFSGGITGSALGSTATGARGALDATATRRLNLVRNIAENMLKPLFRKWMSYNNEFLEDEEVIRYTNEDFVEIRRDDLDGRLDIDISISTAEDNAAKSSELSFLLQTLGNNLPMEMTQLIMGEIAKLSRMPDLEKSIKEYQPKPDPAAEQAKQIEMERLMLENEKIKAEIADRYARAGENEIDRQLKQAKVNSEMAKARKTNSDADRVDLDFVDRDNGFREQYEASEKEKDRKHQIMMAEFQQRAGDTNIGLVRQ